MTTPIHLAYLTGEYPRATDTFIQREVEALRAQGAQVTTYSIRQPDAQHMVGPEQKRERKNTVYLQAMAKNPFRLLGAHLHCLLRSPGKYLRSIVLAWKSGSPGIKGRLYQGFYFAEAGLLASELLARKVSHLHNHFANSSCSVSMLTASLSGLPFSFTLHGPAIFFEPHLWRIDLKLNRAARVACISHYCRSQAMIFADPSRWDRLGIIHCGIDPSQFAVRSHEGVGRKLVTVGRLASVKGMHVLLEAVGRLNAAGQATELTIVGDGPQRGTLEARAKELGIAERVEFTGFQSQAEVREHLASADVFVSSSFAEGVPVVLMEAMAGGVPCVATRIAGVPELVEHEVTGLIASPGDLDALTDAIGRLLRDTELRRRLAEAGRAKVEAEFNIHTEAGKLLGLIGQDHAGFVSNQSTSDQGPITAPESERDNKNSKAHPADETVAVPAAEPIVATPTESPR